MENYVGAALVDLYSKCSSLVDAQHVFVMLPSRDAVSWTSLITGYAEHGLGEKVLYSFKQMQAEGVSVDASVFVGCLKACSYVGALEAGWEIHSVAIKMGLQSELYIGSALVDMYIKCGSPRESRSVFDRIPAQNVVSWNAMLAGYAENEFGEEVLDGFKQMQEEGICPDCVTFICSLKGCGILRALETGREVHAEIIRMGFDIELNVGNKLVDMYAKCGSLAEAEHVFGRLPARSEVSWNALSFGYVEVGLVEGVLVCLSQMQLEGVYVNDVMLVCSLKACGATRWLEIGRHIHSEIVKRGLEKELSTSNTLVDMYGKCGSLEEALQVLNRLPVKDAVSWNALITGYAEHELDEEVLSSLKRMQMEDAPTSAVTFILCLKACGIAGALEIAREIHAQVRKSGLENDLVVGHMLIDTYGKCGSVKEGREVFDRLQVRDTVSWNTMIKTYGENDQGDMAVRCFEDMKDEHVKPDSITFTCLLAACSRAYLVLKGQEYFDFMIEKQEIRPTLDHYGCMVDLYARSGHLYEAVRVIAAMEYPPSIVIIVSLLSACKLYGKVDLGQVCFQQLVEVNQDDGAAYSLMASFYASASRWSDASRVEEMRNYAKAKKKPGSAVIEVNKMLHKFVVGIIQSKDTLSMIEVLSSQMKYEGHIPNLEFVSG